MTHNIHKTAVISKSAHIHDEAFIGPYCIIGENVEIEKDAKLFSHVAIDDRVKIGEGTWIYPFASIGHRPQDLKYAGEESYVEIGKRNQIREHVTIHPGTSGDRMLTRIGDDCLLMVGVHVAHDCTIGNGAILANNVTLGGHVEIGDFVVIGGLSAIQQFVKIGENAMVAGMSGADKDVIPFGMAIGNRVVLKGLNIRGLKRRGFSSHDISSIRSAYEFLFSDASCVSGYIEQRISSLPQDVSSNPHVKMMCEFILSSSGIAMPSYDDVSEDQGKGAVVVQKCFV